MKYASRTGENGVEAQDDPPAPPPPPLKQGFRVFRPSGSEEGHAETDAPSHNSTSSLRASVLGPLYSGVECMPDSIPRTESAISPDMTSTHAKVKLHPQDILNLSASQWRILFCIFM